MAFAKSLSMEATSLPTVSRPSKHLNEKQLFKNNKTKTINVVVSPKILKPVFPTLIPKQKSPSRPLNHQLCQSVLSSRNFRRTPTYLLPLLREGSISRKSEATSKSIFNSGVAQQPSERIITYKGSIIIRLTTCLCGLNSTKQV